VKFSVVVTASQNLGRVKINVMNWVRGGSSVKWVGETKRKILKPMVIPSVVCGIQNGEWFFFYAESLVHSRYNIKKIRSFGWFRKSLYFKGRCREKNYQCTTTDVKVWGRGFQWPEARRFRGIAPSVWRFLQFFNENNTFLGIFRLKFLLKNIIPNFFNYSNTKRLTI